MSDEQSPKGVKRFKAPAVPNRGSQWDPEMVVVVLASDHDRIVAEFENRSKCKLMRYIWDQNRTIATQSRELDKKNRVIEKLREHEDYWFDRYNEFGDMADPEFVELVQRARDKMNAEIEAIERGDA